MRGSRAAQGLVARLAGGSGLKMTCEREKLPALAVGRIAPDSLRRFEHHTDRDDAEDDQIRAGEIGEEFAQYEKDDGAEDRPLDSADATDDGDEDHVHRPIVDAEGGVWRDAELL